jgi:hypothetical protein
MKTPGQEFHFGLEDISVLQKPTVVMSGMLIEYPI